jgi:catechol 2,3-dioxygenase-like lactoylglutathione lyase family enzyme
VTAGPDVVIDRITLIVSDLDRAEDDYVRTFGCRVEHRAAIEPALTGVLCIPPARGRRSLLRLGRERIELLEFTDSAGRPYPPDSTSTDLWFQHMAIVVTDMTDAYQRVMANRRFRPISREGPVRLPGSSGGVTAFKFRDHDGHPLELLAFPERRVPAAWRNRNGNGSFLGVDHTAIAVSDTASSTGFFRSVFGFSEGTCTENHAVVSEHAEEGSRPHRGGTGYRAVLSGHRGRGRAGFEPAGLDLSGVVPLHGAEPAASATPSCSRPCSRIFRDIGNILGLPYRAQWSSPREA